MRTTEERTAPTSRGGILYDASRVRNPADDLFEPAHWAAKGALERTLGGRGSICVLHAGEQRWVLRHYRRGGLMARLSSDRYLWAGEARTRSFAEWRLLAELQRRGLPAPAPVAARYVRDGLTYRADLITEQLAGVRTLADSIALGALDERVWRQVGATIAAFHRQGVHHADLNAHNILLATSPDAVIPVYLLDFDRGRIRARGSWEQGVLSRLKRSLLKIGRSRPVAFSEREWQWLEEEAVS